MVGQPHQGAALQRGQLQQRPGQLTHDGANARNTRPIGQAFVGLQIVQRQRLQKGVIHQALGAHGGNVHLAHPPTGERVARQAGGLLQQSRAAQQLPAPHHAYRALVTIIATAQRQHHAYFDDAQRRFRVALLQQAFSFAKSPLSEERCPCLQLGFALVAQQAMGLADAAGAVGALGHACGRGHGDLSERQGI